MNGSGYIENSDKIIRDVFWAYNDGKKDHDYWNYGAVPDELKGAAKTGPGSLYDQFVAKAVYNYTVAEAIFIGDVILGYTYKYKRTD